MGLKKVASLALALLLMASLSVLGGCAKTNGNPTMEQTPAVAPPVIKADGVLKAGINSAHAPFAGTSNGKTVGIDVDVAAALADTLGLKLELVDTQGSDADALIAAGSVDIVLDVEQSAKGIAGAGVVGPYMLDGPALFMLTQGAEAPQIVPSALAGVPIAAQQDSLAAWTVDQVVSDANLQSVESLNVAFSQLASGQVRYVAADSVIGSFSALDYEGVAGVQMLGDPVKVYIAVQQSNTQLSDAITESLRQIHDNGTLDVILGKWLGPDGAKLIASSEAIMSQSGASLLAGQTATSGAGVQGTAKPATGAGAASADAQAGVGSSASGSSGTE